jgi:hypothetical protein
MKLDWPAGSYSPEAVDQKEVAKEGKLRFE